MAMINRDPFARHELHRETVSTREACKWCGGTRKGGKLFEYRTERDDSTVSRRSVHNGLFCSKSCHDAYHG
jgi:hypothetical protein